MLSIGKLTAARAEYYVAAVAHGAEDYYTGRGEVPGYWIGSASVRAGLSGVVEDDQFRAMLAGVDPSDGTVLARANRRVAAFDLTFSAPKSVSLLWALGGPDIARVVIRAHEEALADAVAYVEREAVFVRRGHDGTERLVGGGLMGAAFRHRTSRAGDPQLHTHVVVANATRGPDGEWSALDGRHLYAQARTAGYLYQAGLRARLRERLGVEFDAVVNGNGDIAGVPARVIREFSRRRAEIEAALGPDATANDARRATLVTRRAKDRDIDSEGLHVEWAARAAELGFTAETIRKLCTGPRRAERTAVQIPVRCAENLTEQASSFDRRDVLQALASAHRNGANLAELEAAADTVLTAADVVMLGVGRYGVRYTTRELLAIETRLVDSALARGAAGVAIVEDLRPVLARYSELSREQRRMVRTLTRDGAGVTVVIGAAGSGKTHALAAARDAWEAAGYTVIGAALAARAARQLQTSAQITACTLERLLRDLDRPDTPGLTRRAVVVVDEAAMVGTRALARLAAHADRADAKLVLVGDHRQLPEIDAGGAFVALARRLGAVRLLENRRQQDPTERRALHALRRGHVDEALAMLNHRGRFTETPTADDAAAHMVHDWYAAIAAGDDAVMLAARRVDVANLNRRARALLVAQHRITGVAVNAAGRSYAAGDLIVTLRNDRQLGLLNGQRGSVVRADPIRRSLLVRFDDDPHHRVVPAEYLDDSNIDHGYALTIHRAQGLTCDRAFVLSSEIMNAEAGYSALTRGRLENHLYVTAERRERDAHDDDRPSSVESVRRSLRRSIRDYAAVDAGLRLRSDPVPHLPDMSEPKTHVDLGW